MQAIKNKLRSQRGASLTFALLIFLVCAVVGSVVLAAGTATSGRLAGSTDSGKVGTMVGMEQRYHAVNSAAELLKKELTSGKTTATITKTTTTTTVTTSYYDVDNDGNVYLHHVDDPDIIPIETYTSKSSVPFSTKKLKTDLTEAETEILKYFAKEILIGGWADSDDSNIWTKPRESKSIPQFTITVEDNENLAVDVVAEPELIPGGGNSYAGNLIIKLANHKGNQKYYVEMRLTATGISWKSKLIPETTPPAPVVESTTATKTIITTDPETGEEKETTVSYISEVKETTVETQTETKTPTVTWKLVSMKVLDQGENNDG